MSTFVLKLMAVIIMLIDHTGAVLLNNNMIFRTIGRLAFPIFVFFLVEGFHHTSDIKKYLKRLGIFALISEIPFDLALYKNHFGADFISDFSSALKSNTAFNLLIRRLFRFQNVFFTLFLGLLLIYLISLIDAKYKKDVIISNLINALLTLAFCAIAYILKTDYDIGGILLIAAFYLFRGNKFLLTAAMLIVTGSCYTVNGQVSIEILATLAMIPISFYNGKKGKNIKYIFYIFYPAHLLILYLLSLLKF